jgi:hypothetical protein
MGILAEIIGTDTPVAVLPFINTALAARTPLITAVEKLRAERVQRQDVDAADRRRDPVEPRYTGRQVRPYASHAA